MNEIEISITGDFKDLYGFPIGEHTFTNTIEFDSDYNIITSLSDLNNYFFVRGTYIYYSMTNIIRTYTTNYFFTSSGDDLIPEWDYPGKAEVTSKKVRNNLSDEELNEKIAHYESLGYDETVSFLKGDITGPFESNIYESNPLIWKKYNYGSQTSYWGNDSDQGEDPNNLHMVDPITFKGKITYPNSDDNYESIVRCFQHETPQKLDNRVSSFMERFIDARLESYR